MFLSVTTQDKIALWEKIKLFWYEEELWNFKKDITISTLRTNYLENLSEAYKLGTIQRVVGRYVPLLVSPETRDSYSTRLIRKDNSYNIILLITEKNLCLMAIQSLGGKTDQEIPNMKMR